MAQRLSLLGIQARPQGTKDEEVKATAQGIRAAYLGTQEVDERVALQEPGRIRLLYADPGTTVVRLLQHQSGAEQQDEGDRHFRQGTCQAKHRFPQCQQIGVQGTADIVTPTGPGASSTERSRHARMLAEARSAVHELDQVQHFRDYSSSRYTDVLKNIREVVEGRIC